VIEHLLHHDSLTIVAIERERPRMEYTKQIMMDMKKDSYKELNYNREAWRTLTNQSHD